MEQAHTAVTQQLGEAEDPALRKLYTLLVLVRGAELSSEDVHDAWAVWTALDRGLTEHASLCPFDELDEGTQGQDLPYREALHAAARSLGSVDG